MRASGRVVVLNSGERMVALQGEGCLGFTYRPAYMFTQVRERVVVLNSGRVEWWGVNGVPHGGPGDIECP